MWSRAGRARRPIRSWRRPPASPAPPTTAPAEHWPPAISSLQRGALGDLGPFGDLALKKGSKLLRRTTDKMIAERDAALLHIRHRQDALDVGIDLGDDVLARAPRRKQRVPAGLVD